MKYVDLSHDVAELFEEAQHLSRRPAWVSVLDWASIRASRPAGMNGRLARAEAPLASPAAPAPTGAAPPPPPPPSRARIRRARVAAASPVNLRLVVRTAPEVVAATQVAGPVPVVTRLPCQLCGGVLELREGNRWPLHLRAPGGCGVGRVRQASGA